MEEIFLNKKVFSGNEFSIICRLFQFMKDTLDIIIYVFFTCLNILFTSVLNIILEQSSCVYLLESNKLKFFSFFFFLILENFWLCPEADNSSKLPFETSH